MSFYSIDMTQISQTEQEALTEEYAMLDWYDDEQESEFDVLTEVFDGEQYL